MTNYTVINYQYLDKLIPSYSIFLNYSKYILLIIHFSIEWSEETDPDTRQQAELQPPEDEKAQDKGD